MSKSDVTFPQNQNISFAKGTIVKFNWPGRSEEEYIALVTRLFCNGEFDCVVIWANTSTFAIGDLREKCSRTNFVICPKNTLVSLVQ
jgi:hypothetical protein